MRTGFGALILSLIISPAFSAPKTTLSPKKIQIIWAAAKKNAVLGQPKRALIQAKKLLGRAKLTPNQKDQLNLLLGRIYFQMNADINAIEAYKKIRSNSDYWLEAQEEIAWTYARQKKWPESLANLQTVLNPRMTSQVFSESYYLSAYVNLKSCQYIDVLEGINQFKAHFKEKVAGLDQIIQSGSNKALKKIWQQDLKAFSWLDLGYENTFLPRAYYRDPIISKVLLNGSSLDIKEFVIKKSEAEKRFVQLARRDKKEIQRTIKFLKLVEAELTQIVYMSKDLQIVEAKKFKKNNDSNIISFPVDGEFWIDELKDFKVSMESCKRKGV